MDDQDQDRKLKGKMKEYEEDPVRRVSGDGNSSAGASGALRIPGPDNHDQDAPRSAPVVNQPHGGLMGQQAGDALGGISSYHGAEHHGLPLPPLALGNSPPPQPTLVCPRCNNWIHYALLVCESCQVRGLPPGQRTLDSDPPPEFSRKAWEWGAAMARRITRTETGPYARGDGTGNRSRSGGAAGTGTMRVRDNRRQNVPPPAPVVNQPHGRPMGQQSGVATGGSTSGQVAVRQQIHHYQPMVADLPMLHQYQRDEASQEPPPAFHFQWPLQPQGGLSMDLPPQPHHQHPPRPQQHPQPPLPVGAGVQQLQHQPAAGNHPVGLHGGEAPGGPAVQFGHPGLQPPSEAHPVFQCPLCDRPGGRMEDHPLQHVCPCDACLIVNGCPVCVPEPHHRQPPPPVGAGVQQLQHRPAVGNHPVGQQHGEAPEGPAVQLEHPGLQPPPEAHPVLQCPICDCPGGRTEDHPLQHICLCNVCSIAEECPVCASAIL